MLIPRWYAVFLLAVFFLVFSAPLPVLAEPIRVGIGFAISPYVIRDENAGVEVDVIRDAFRSAGFDVEFAYLPNLRLPVAFAEGRVDCVATNADYDIEADTGVPAHYSDTTVIFQNYAVTLEKNGFVITSIADLADKRVLGFNNATKYLGREFAAMAAANKRYSELADQSLQARLLLSGRVDVVISDRRIFLYWRQQLTRSPLARAVSVNQRFAFHAIFPPAPRHVVFRSEELCTHFNRGLGHLHSCGGFKVIEERYAGVETE